jgi:E3 ubiquitin-protein ligase HUWE1
VAETPGALQRQMSLTLTPGPFQRQTSLTQGPQGGGEDGKDRERRFVQFLEHHRELINEIVKKRPALLDSDPYRILTRFPMLLEFQVKAAYFRQRLGTASNRRYRGGVRLRIRREHLFEDSYQQVMRLQGPELRARVDIHFVGEQGIDAGGLLREWYYKLSQAMMNPNYALFCQSTLGSETYQPNQHSKINADHLLYFQFCGRAVAKAIADEQLLDCHFTRAFYKQILGIPVSWRDLAATDESLYKSLLFMLEQDITPMEVRCSPS